MKRVLMTLVALMVVLNSAVYAAWKDDRLGFEAYGFYGWTQGVYNGYTYAGINGVVSYELVKHLNVGVSIGWGNKRSELMYEGGPRRSKFKNISTGQTVLDVRSYLPLGKWVDMVGVVQYGALFYLEGRSPHSAIFTPQLGLRFKFVEKMPYISLRGFYSRMCKENVNVLGLTLGIGL